MDTKQLHNQVENFVPHSDFHDFFDSWKKEEERKGMNWSPKTIEKFKKVMFTGMVFLNAVNGETQETVQQEKVEAKPEPKVKTEEPRTRSRATSEEAPTRTRNRVGNSEASATINNGSRTRTRTRNPN